MAEWMECSVVRPGPERGVELGNNVHKQVLELVELRGGDGQRRRAAETHEQRNCSTIRPGCERGVELEGEDGRLGEREETRGEGTWMECSGVRPGPEKGVELETGVQQPMLELAELRGGLRQRTAEAPELRGCSRIRPGCERGVELEGEEGSASTCAVLSRVSGATQLYESEGGSTRFYADASAGESTQRYSDAASEAGTGSQDSPVGDAGSEHGRCDD